MKTSIMLLNFNRPEMTQSTLNHNLNNTGTKDYELLFCDQGANGEPRTPDFEKLLNYIESIKPAYLRLNNYNEGIARSLNQLIIRAKGEYIYILGNDILMPDKWLSTAIEYAEDIPKSGIIGYEGQDLILPEKIIDCLSGQKRTIRYEQNDFLDGSQVYGPILITRQLLDEIGGFCEAFHPYGPEDADICFRAKLAGFMVYYIPGMKIDHIGLQYGNSGTYKSIKEFSFFSNVGLHRWRIFNYSKIGYYEPFPGLREALF